MLESLKQWWRGKKAIPTGAPPQRATAQPIPTLAGGRQSVDNDQFFLSTGLNFLTPISSDEYWRNYDLDAKTLDRVSPAKLLELLADLSPDVSKALWDFLLFMNPGHEAKAFRPGTQTVDTNAQAALDALLKNLHGSFALSNTLPLDVIIASLNIGVFLRGAFFAELVLDDSGRMPLDIATPDPKTVVARSKSDPVRGQIWEIGQWQDGKFVVLDRPTICYIPVHPLPGKPYGRALAAPALFSTLFLLGMLHDLRRVISQQGYPRLDIGIDFKEMGMPETQDADKVEKWVNNVVKQVQDTYGALEPDSAFIHASAITVNRPVGTIDASSLGKVDDIISVLERFSIRALKSMPLLFGVNEAVSETHANRQWEVCAAGFKSLQHLEESLLEHLLRLGLQAQGIQADVQFRFAELRAAELLRDAQVASLTADVARKQYDNGWISQDEAAQMGAKKDKADQPEPRNKSAVAPNNNSLVDEQADPGSQRRLDPELSERVN